MIIIKAITSTRPRMKLLTTSIDLIVSSLHKLIKFPLDCEIIIFFNKILLNTIFSSFFELSKYISNKVKSC